MIYIQFINTYSIKNLIEYSTNCKYKNYDNLYTKYQAYQAKILKKYLNWKKEYKTNENKKKLAIHYIYTKLLTEDEILLLETFHKCNYRIKDISLSLNIHRNTVHNRLVKMGAKVKFYLENLENNID